MRWILMAIVASLLTASSASAQTSGDEGAITAWLQSFDRAFVAKDLDKLASFYHPDVTIFEGGGVNNGWADYRDHHIGPELKGFENLQFEHRNIVVHVLDGGRVAYVTSEYALKARANGRDVDSGGLETLVLVKTADGWRIRHSHTSARRRAAAGGR
ncbi:MAG: nuclear transport factor 2 family protein [Acidobacteria bacterium]|nr:nuclear transport factor 2 family protein [Acidobacteriota bacterium]